MRGTFINAVTAYARNDQSTLEDIVSSIPLNEVEDTLNSLLRSDCNSWLSVSRALLTGLAKDSVGVKKKKVLLVLSNNLCSFDESSSVSSKIGTLLSTELVTLSADDVCEFGEDFIKLLETATNLHWFQLLSSIFSFWDKTEAAIVARGSVSGSDIRMKLICQLCDVKLSAAALDNVLISLRDCELRVEESNKVITKVLEALKEIDFDNVPSVTHKILLFASSHKEVEQNCLLGICRYFDRCSEGADDSYAWICAMGTCILHVVSCVKQNQRLGRSLLSVFKRLGSEVLNIFPFSLLLTLTQSERFRVQALDLAKSSILVELKDSSQRNASLWIKQQYENKCNAEELLSTLVDKSIVGSWDYVVAGLCELGFLLLEANLTKVTIVGSGIMSDPSNISHNVCNLGQHLLLNCFKSHIDTRQKIVHRILSTLLSRNASGLYFVDLLSKCVENAAGTIVECMPKVREVVERLDVIPWAVCGPFLKSLTPILKCQPSSRDAVVLSLRKAAFSKDINARKVSVVGFLELLKHLKAVTSLSSSQSLSSQSFPCFSSQIYAKTATVNQETVCLEIVGCLRRALAQQGDVRQLLYQGMSDVVRKNKQLRGEALLLLLRQITQCCEENEEKQPPLHTYLLVASGKGEPLLLEPFSILLNSLVMCLEEAGAFSANDNENSQSVSETVVDPQLVRKCFRAVKSLSLRMADVELEDFQLDKSADYTSSATGLKNCLLAFQLLEIYEVLIEFVWVSSDFALESMETLLGLYAGFAKLTEVLNEKAVGATGKKVAAATTPGTLVKSTANSSQITRCSEPRISIRCFDSVIRHLLCDQNPARQEALNVLRQNTDFVKWWFEQLLKKVAYLLVNPSHRDLRKPENICAVARLMLQYYAKTESVDESMRRARLYDQLKFKSLEIYARVLELITRWLPDYFEETLDVIAKDIDANRSLTFCSKNQKAYKHAVLFLNLLGNQLMLESTGGDEGNPRTAKEELVLVQIMRTVSSEVNPESTEASQFFATLVRNCRDQEIKDGLLSKAVLSLCLSFYRLTSTKSEFYVSLSKQISARFPMISEDQENNKTNESPEKFGIISKRAPVGCLQVFLNFVTDHLNDIAFLVTKLSVEASSVECGKSKKQPNDRSPKREAAICGELAQILIALNEISRVKVPAVVVELTTKCFIRFYTVLSQLVKYYLLALKLKTVDIGKCFGTLLRSTGRTLSRSVYGYLLYVQERDSDQSVAGKNKIMREMKVSSDLVFAMETFQNNLTQLSIKAKTNFMENFRHVNNRDFRINADKVQQAMLERGDDSDNSSESSYATEASSASIFNSVRCNANAPSSNAAPEKKRKCNTNTEQQQTRRIKK